MKPGESTWTPESIKDAILDLLLYRPNEGATTSHLARLMELDSADVHAQLVELEAARLVLRAERLHGSAWLPTSQGITKASAARSIRARRHEAEAPGPVRVTMCNANEVPVRSHAMVCIDEADLDDWWDGLDVELKSAAFLNYNFGSARSEVDVTDRVPVFSVPIVGVAGESAKEWQEIAERLNGLPQSTLCYYCHLAAPGALFLREGRIPPSATILRRVCSERACLDRWSKDWCHMSMAIARGEDLGGEPLQTAPVDPDAPRSPENLVCTKCGGAGGQWEMYMSEAQHAPGEPLAAGEVLAYDVNGGGPWAYTHRCAEKAAEPIGARVTLQDAERAGE